MRQTSSGVLNLRTRGEYPECPGRVYPDECARLPYERDSHRSHASRTASAVPGGFLVFAGVSREKWGGFDPNKTNKADTPHMPYTPHPSDRTREAKTDANRLEFEAYTHHQSSIIK